MELRGEREMHRNAYVILQVTYFDWCGFVETHHFSKIILSKHPHADEHVNFIFFIFIKSPNSKQIIEFRCEIFWPNQTYKRITFSQYTPKVSIKNKIFVFFDLDYFVGMPQIYITYCKMWSRISQTYPTRQTDGHR